MPKQAKPAGLVVRRVKLDDLHADAANVNTHPDKNLRAIKGSLSQFGQVEPLVVHKGTGKVIGGNGRLEVMRDMGLAECDVVEFDGTPTEAAALGIALNHTAKTSIFDDAGLADLLRGLQAEDFDLDAVGFTDDEVNQLCTGLDAGPMTFTADEDDAGADGATTYGDDSDDEPPPASHVRMVQLFLNAATFPEFNRMVASLGVRYDTDNATDTVMACLKRADADAR